MKQYRIKNPRYSGEVIVRYNSNGMLDSIDFSETDMNLFARSFMKQSIPAHENEITCAFTSPETVVISEDVLITFDMFWEAFDNKYNRSRCESLWERLSKSEKAAAYFNVKNYKKVLKRTGQYQMHPDTWLRNKCFNDYKIAA